MYGRGDHRQVGWRLVLVTWCALALLALAGPGRAAAAGSKWIDVDLSQQWLTAYEGETVVWDGPISSGRVGYETPTGTFFVLRKAASEDMRGGDPDLPGGAYYQPDVPSILYFTPRGHAIHGVYWHHRFGTPLSHGCVGASLAGAAFLYDWAPLGTPILIHY